MKFRRIETDYVAVVIIAVCLLGIAAFECINPSKIIGRAIDKSLCEFAARETANYPWFDDKLNKNMEKGNITMDIALNATEGKYKNGGIGFVIDRNDSSKIAQANFNLNYNGTAALAVKAYADNDNVIISAPALYGKNFTMDMDILSKNIYAMSGIEFDENSTQNVFFDPKLNNNTYNYAFTNIKNGISLSGKKAWRSAGDYLTVNSLDKTEINGLKCKGYEIKLNAEGTKAFMTAFGNAIENSTELKNGLSAYLKGNMYVQYGMISAEDLAAQTLKQLNQGITSMVEKGEVKETDIKVYINGGRLIKAEIGGACTMLEQQLDVNAGVDFNGENNPTDNMVSFVSLTSEGNELRFDYVDTNKTDENGITTNKSITQSSNGASMRGSVVTTYNDESDDFTVKAAYAIDDEEVMGVNASGKVNTDKGYITADADSISFTDGTNTIKADGHFYVKPLEETIEPIEGESVDILNLEDQEEASKIMTEMQGKLHEILSKFEG